MRITASDVIGVEVLPPVITALRAEHPELVLELVLTDRMQDLVRREADMAVRMARPRQELLVASRVGEIELGLHAHQRYLSRHGTPKTMSDRANHALIGFDQITAFIRSGAGIGVCQSAIARRDDSIVRLLARQFSLQMETWITMHEDLRNSPRCRVTFDALVKDLRQYTRG